MAVTHLPHLLVAAGVAATDVALGISATGRFTNAQCEDLNRRRNIETKRQAHLTKAVLCDTQPAACVTEMLFAHEVYWSEKQAQAVGGIKCARWQNDDDWPTREPFLTRPPGLGGLWQSVLSRMPNRTLWLHGDSITTQVCEASLCSLVRERVVPQPPLCTAGLRHPSTRHCEDVDDLSRSLGMQIRGVRLPNGARLLCSAVGVLERDKIAAVLAKLAVSVVVINYGLHYHSPHNFGLMLDELLPMLRRWADAAPGRVPLFRELSAQHFKGGSWKPGADRPPPGAPCECEPLATRGPEDKHERALDNQNVAFNDLAVSRSRPLHVGVVPFFNLTAPRHSMHRRHFCSFSNQLHVGRCCDCTHLCYTPLLWDTFFAGMWDAMVAQPGFAAAELAGGEATAAAARGPRRAGRHSGRGRGRSRGGGGGGGGDRGGGRGGGGGRRKKLEKQAMAQAREMERRAAANA
jgi:uncharacterized membrane protein YgcG